jgi:hypothetical protein
MGADAELKTVLPMIPCILASVAAYASLRGPWWTVCPVLYTGFVGMVVVQVRLPLVRS